MLTPCRNLVERIRGYGDEKGVTTVEYAIMLALVALAVAAATPGLSDAVITVFTDTTTAMTPPVVP
jgi:Flp pilus assembly pilin Flp